MFTVTVSNHDMPLGGVLITIYDDYQDAITIADMSHIIDTRDSILDSSDAVILHNGIEHYVYMHLHAHAGELARYLYSKDSSRLKNIMRVGHDFLKVYKNEFRIIWGYIQPKDFDGKSMDDVITDRIISLMHRYDVCEQPFVYPRDMHNDTIVNGRLKTNLTYYEHVSEGIVAPTVKLDKDLKDKILKSDIYAAWGQVILNRLIIYQSKQYGVVIDPENLYNSDSAAKFINTLKSEQPDLYEKLVSENIIKSK